LGLAGSALHGQRRIGRRAPVKILALIAGGLLAALAAVGVWAWTPDRPRAALEARYLGASTTLMEVAGTTLRVRDTGPRSAPVLICMHGFGASLETWEPWARVLDQHYHVIRFDFPGSGLSEPDRTGDYSDARSLTLVKALMRQMGIDRAVLIGNSMGGRIAWKFAAAYPALVSKLVLISPDGFASPGFEYGQTPKVPAVAQLMKYFLPKIILRANLRAAYADPARLGDAQLDRYYDLLLAPGNRIAMIARMQQTVLETPVPLLQRIQAPTLLLWGEADHMIPHSNAAEYLRALRNAKLVSFPDLGHIPQEESPEESVRPVEQFLAQ
jgi:pimeloyl-ACP methyl ester carboxylesterase